LKRVSKSHPDAKKRGKFGPVWKCCWLYFLLWGCYSSWVRTSWPHGEQGMLAKVTNRLREAVRRKMPDLWRGKCGCSTMRMQWWISPFWFIIFSQNMRQRSSPSLHTRQTLH
jgi:hypothetical protein